MNTNWEDQIFFQREIYFDVGMMLMHVTRRYFWPNEEPSVLGGSTGPGQFLTGKNVLKSSLSFGTSIATWWWWLPTGEKSMKSQSDQVY